MNLACAGLNYFETEAATLVLTCIFLCHFIKIQPHNYENCHILMIPYGVIVLSMRFCWEVSPYEVWLFSTIRPLQLTEKAIFSRWLDVNLIMTFRLIWSSVYSYIKQSFHQCVLIIQNNFNTMVILQFNQHSCCLFPCFQCFVSLHTVVSGLLVEYFVVNMYWG